MELRRMNDRPAAEPAHPVDLYVGARLRIRRKMMGLSQTQVADALGITFQQIQKYERGANRVSASMLARIATTLKTPVAELFGEVSPERGSVDEVAALLAQPGAIELLQAYAELPRGQARAALVDFIRSLAAERRALALEGRTSERLAPELTRERSAP